MEYNSSMPIYLQVLNDLKKKLVTSQISLGDKLPSVRDLALNYQINPNTASRVYTELEREGLCFTKRGMGTFVTEDSEQIRKLKSTMALDLIQTFMEGMKHLGYTSEEAIQILQKHADIK